MLDKQASAGAGKYKHTVALARYDPAKLTLLHAQFGWAYRGVVTLEYWRRK